MEEKQDAKGDESFTKAQVAKMLKRHTSVTVGAVIFGLLIAQSISEGLTGQAGWLRFLVLVVAAGFAAGFCVEVLARMKKGTDLT